VDARAERGPGGELERGLERELERELEESVRGVASERQGERSVRKLRGDIERAGESVREWWERGREARGRGRERRGGGAEAVGGVSEFRGCGRVRGPGAIASTERGEGRCVRSVWIARGRVPGIGIGGCVSLERSLQNGDSSSDAGRFVRADDSLSAERNAAMRSLSSSVHVNWFESRTGYAALSELFARSGVDLTGERFIKGLGALCGTPCHGTLIDIASIGKQNIRHSWHQDSGYDRYTVMLGFPSSTPSEELPEGVGVFTHAVKLSHPLAQQHAEGSVIQWENYVPYEGDFDAKYIARPVFKRGQELMIYRDSSHLHSAPDASHREAVWRFM